MMNSRTVRNRIFDLVVVGGGPAGISAATQATRLGLDVMLVEKEKLGGTIRLARRVDNLPPWPPVKGKFLAEIFKQRLLQTDVIFIKGEVIRIRPGLGKKHLFQVSLKNRKNLVSRAIILATGQKFYLPDELNFLKGKALFPGQVQPELVIPGTKVAIIGGGEVALDQALYFSDCGAQVCLMARSALKANAHLLEEFRSRGIPVKPIKRLLGFKKQKPGLKVLSWLSSNDELKTEDFHFLLVAAGKKPEIPEIEGCPAEELFQAGFGWKGDTKLPGLYVAGDLKNGKDRYVSLAVADGLRAGLSLFDYLLNQA